MKHEQLVLKLEQMVIDDIESPLIDKEIEKQGLPEDERKIIFSHIQNFQIDQIKYKQAKEENLNIKILGWTILSVGLIITIGTYIFNRSLIVIAYGAILFGIYVLMRKKFDTNLEDEAPKRNSLFDKGLFKKF